LYIQYPVVQYEYVPGYPYIHAFSRNVQGLGRGRAPDGRIVTSLALGAWPRVPQLDCLSQSPPIRCQVNLSLSHFSAPFHPVNVPVASSLAFSARTLTMSVTNVKPRCVFPATYERQLPGYPRAPSKKQRGARVPHCTRLAILNLEGASEGTRTGRWSTSIHYIPSAPVHASWSIVELTPSKVMRAWLNRACGQARRLARPTHFAPEW
jgi:hypothetical protein